MVALATIRGNLPPAMPEDPAGRAEPTDSGAPDPSADAIRLRQLLQELVRGFGFLAASQTPCGQPVSPSYAHALTILLERKRLGQTTSQVELGASLGIDKSNVARLCARMEAAGHVVQKRADEDRRSRMLELTRKGSALAGRIEEASRARFGVLMRGVPGEQRQSLLECLAVLNTAVRALRTDEEQQP